MASTDPKSSSAPSQAVLERLRSLCRGLPNPSFASRLRAVYEESVRSIDGLGQLALDSYDDLAETGCPDLSMWEKVAPAIRDTLLDVNRLLAVIREHFPAGTHEERSVDGTAATGEQAAEARRLESAAAEQIGRLGSLMAAAIAEMGERMRSPQVVSDQWNLLGLLQEFRGLVRSKVGDLIFLSASVFEPVSRSEVVPGHVQDLEEAIAVRRAVVDAARLMSVHQVRVAVAGEGQIADCVASLAGDLDELGRSRIFGLLRTPDRRGFVEFRALLRRFPHALPPRALRESLDEFVRFVRALSAINRRAVLIEHDRELLAACAVRLEEVDQLRGSDHASALARFGQALGSAQGLYGRAPGLDGYLRRARKGDLGGLSAEALAVELEGLRAALAEAVAP